MPYKVLCVVPSRPEDLKAETVRSVLNQTYPVEMLVMLPRRINKPTIAARVTTALNDGLSHVRLSKFDYLLRVDGDTVIPSNFIEENIKPQADLCGRTGHAMLIKVKTFQRISNGKFNPVKNEDSYLGMKFKSRGAKVISWQVPAQHTPVVHKMSEHWDHGVQLYVLGYEPVHVLAKCFIKSSFRFYSFMDFVPVISYFVSAFKRVQKLDVANWVRSYQVRRLVNLRAN